LVNKTGSLFEMREIVHMQAAQCGNQIGAKVNIYTRYNIHIYKRPFNNSSYVHINLVAFLVVFSFVFVKCRFALGLTGYVFF
jgi:hypothetical protein